jgi:UDP-N-acetyl-2-amino-2-deoxyglucuronate dehydrogenase
MRASASNDLVNYGILGCGTIAAWHAQPLKEQVSGVRLLACCDEVPGRARQFAERFGIERAYDSIDAFLADPDVDAVSVCTPSGLHSENVIRVSNAGKHAMTEKPIDITLPRVDAMIETCRRNGTQLGVIFQRRTAPLWQVVRETVQGGKLGRMVLGDAYLKYYRSQAYYDSGAWRGTWALDGGGALMNQGVHLIDILQWVMGPVDTVFSFAGHLVRDIEVEDTCVASLKFQSGALGTLEGATSVIGSAQWERDAAGAVQVTEWGGLNHRLEFHGERGSIMVEGERIARWVVPGEPEPELDEGGIGDSASNPTAIGMEGHRIQLQDFVDALRENRKPMVTGEDARPAVELILAIYQSARTGQPVRLPLVGE